MKFKEYGFRPVYHNYCIFELNDMLRNLCKDCPDIGRASHAVCYGYIDAKKGLMLEVLGAGKQAPKYFYFKNPYEGERITIPASNLLDVEFDTFVKLEPRFRKKFAARVEVLKKYNSPGELEKTRGEEFDFLDPFRDLQYPDVIRVTFEKSGLKPEEVPVKLTGTGDHCLVGTVNKKPKQEFGLKKGDSVEFHARETEDKKVEIYVDLNPTQLTKEALADGGMVKAAIQGFEKVRTNDNLGYLLALLRSSYVVVPLEGCFNEEAQAILDKLEEEGKDVDSLPEAEHKKVDDGLSFLVCLLESNSKYFFPVFTNAEEMQGHFNTEVTAEMPFIHVLEMTAKAADKLEAIVVNAFTDNFTITKDLFDIIHEMTPLTPEDPANDPRQDAIHIPDVTEGAGRQPSDFYSDVPLEMNVAKMDVFSYAFYQNNLAPIRGIQVFNHQEDPLKGLFMRITSDFHFFKKYEAPLPDIPGGKPITLQDPHLIINGSTLAALTETANTIITVEICKDGKTVCRQRGRMQVLAYDQWQGGETYQNLLPAFVVPNHPLIPALLHDAADRLKKWGKDSSLEGYQAKNPNRVRELAAAAFAAIQKKNIVYAEPPASFFVSGQRIRTPEIIMEQRLGTCMDMTLLYAAVLEAMGLHALLVMMNGHIFAGVWLKERTPEEFKKSDVIINNIEQLTMRFGTGADEITFVECTMMCSDKDANFEDAEKVAKYDDSHHLGDLANFRYAVDVEMCRRTGIRPIASRVKNGATYEIDIKEKTEDELTDAPTDLGLTTTEVSVHTGKKITNKRELWESKLLDLSTHNMLLNLPQNPSIEPIMSTRVYELEDALADGHEFNLRALPDWILGVSRVTEDKKGKPKEQPWLSLMLKEHGVFEITDWPVGTGFDFNEKLRQEYHNHRLYTYSNDKQLERELTTIYRAARASQQENGVSSLYLAVGLLRWFTEAESKTPCYAPLILVPIEIVRKSANQGYALHARDEEPHFNTALLEMLRQLYNLDIDGLDPLPADDHGTNIKKVFQIVRHAVMSVPGWDVVETCVIGNFSFAQFAMWNDIHTSGDMLEKSDVVRSLMKGHVDWDITIPESLDEEKTYLPITVDGTQLQAIKMAAHGMTFVLHGPPGTGKSQTITGMIANLMAQGKTVLFVAEKMAALSVVQRRLTSLGIGDFCLELHSDKANKKQVLTQLDKALAIKHPSRKTEYEEYLEKTAKSRAKLDGYAKHLHTAHNCGYSLRELIDLYETVRDEEHFVRFNSWEVGDLTRQQLKSHLPLIGQLKAAGAAVGSIGGHPLTGVGLSSYSADVRRSLRRITEKYEIALNAARAAGEKTAAVLGAETPQNKAGFANLEKLIALYNEKKGIEPRILVLLNNDPQIAYAYFDQQIIFQAEEQQMLAQWKPEFLQMDMSAILTKHEAAGKKFFGRFSAMANVTAEVQAYANGPLTYEQIPGLLKKVAQYQEYKKKFQAVYDALPEETKTLIKQLPTREEYSRAQASAVACRQQAEIFPDGLDAIIALTEKPENEKLFEDYKETISRLLEMEREINTLLSREEKADTENWIAEELEFCAYLMRHASDLKDWGIYNQVCQDCLRAGLAPVVDAYEHSKEIKDLEQAYRKGIYYALINNIISSDNVLSCFSGATFNESVQHFKKLDDIMLQQTKQEIYYLLASHVPTSWDSPEIGSELNLLRKAIGSNARGMSIRALFDRISHVLPTLCPCMLMSPNSVAQYLAQDNNLFDVVIFDEASQLPTCKSIGALARAKNAVIVGDPKQMPPTSFFAGSGPEIDDLALDDLDSILDDALALGIPSQHLQWHYRSTHESLIAFSNNEFYDNKMYTFPSANDRERHVTAVHVEGLYAKNTNVKEAEAVVQEIVRRFMDPKLKKQSIGVVTFNVKQQTLIENLLAKQFQSNPELDVWANSGDDPLFVKNLENVQGDERDVILFSIGYGPDEKGHISMNFGPINKLGGGKRLNVAFSRARATMTIFASLYSSDIKLTDSSPDGLKAFHDFLKFAEGQDISTESASEAKAKLAKAGILQSICQAIRDHGYQCETMVGHSDFHIDIAVVDPFEPTRYMMGILLDGDTYKQTKNTRDREVAQIGVLKNLGWSLHRVWTIDWWDNRDKEIRKLLNKLDDLKIAAEKRIKEMKEAEKAHKAEEAARAAEAERLKAELEEQAAEVVADDEEAEAENTAHVAEKVAEQTAATEDHADYSDNTSVEDTGARLGEGNESGKEKPDAQDATDETPDDEEQDIDVDYSLNTSVADTAARFDEGQSEILAEPEAREQLVSEESKADTVEAESANHTAEEATETSSEHAQEAVYVFADYNTADLPADRFTAADYTASKNNKQIQAKVLTLLEAEAPIQKDQLIRRIIKSFGVSKNKAVTEATERALKAVKAKTTRQNGVAYCWLHDQDPNTYRIIRGGDSNKFARSFGDICQQEMKNAICYALQQSGPMDKATLLKEASRVLGYQRMNDAMASAIDTGFKYAKKTGEIMVDESGNVTLGSTDKA